MGAADLTLNYYHAIQIGLPAHAGEFGAAYAIPVIFVPLLMITHVVAFYLLLRPLVSKWGMMTPYTHAKQET